MANGLEIIIAAFESSMWQRGGGGNWGVVGEEVGGESLINGTQTDLKPKFYDGERVLCFHGLLLQDAKCAKGQKDKQGKYFIHRNG